MKYLLLIVALSLTFPMAVHAQNFRYTVNNASSTVTVNGTGQHVLTSDLTLEDAFAVAEDLSKLDASKKLGEYVEVLKITDTDTGQVKEVIASVSASILSYDVLNKDTVMIDGEVVVHVEIVANAKQGELDAALSRYFNNEDYKKALNEAQSRLSSLNAEVKELNSINANLVSLSSQLGVSLDSSQAEVGDLKSRLELIRVERDRARGRVVSKLNNYTDALYSIVASKKSVSSKEHSKLFQSEELDNAMRSYLSNLEALVSTVSYKQQHSVKKSPDNNSKIVRVFPFWNFPTDAVSIAINGKRDANLRLKDRYRSDGIKMYSHYIGTGVLELPRREYAIIFKLEVNGQVREIPVLVPVSFDGNLSSHEDCNMAQPLGSHYAEYWCFNYSFSPGGMSKSAVIWSSLEDTAKDFIFRVDRDDDIDIKATFEIRGISNRSVVYEKRN